ncbi:hypothetical protein C6502_05430 [Candidatus Poribacteria bacterium]|nr:MAG: hypothetical protein C6502_05430 [Candidatus Poribacteria bacterium]
MRFSRIDLVLIPILMVGFVLRIVGLGVGLPDHPDPRESLIAQDILNLIHLESPPQIYNWPGTAWFYLIALIGVVLETFGLELTVAQVIWLGRFTNVLLSTATIWLTYQVGTQFYNRSIGLIGSGLLAVAMLHATNESRFALVDIPATFCVTLLLWFCARTQSVSFRRAVWLGVIAGIGFAVKFTTIFAGLSVVAFLFLKSECFRPSDLLLKLATVIGVAGATFTIICPYWLIDLFSTEWNLFFDALLYEASHYQKGHFGLFVTSEIDWFNRFTYLWTLLGWGMGTPLASLVIFGAVLAIIQRKDGDRLLLAFVIPYLLFIGLHKLKFVRHLLLIYPVLILFAAGGIDRLGTAFSQSNWTRRNSILKQWATPILYAVILGGVGVYSLIYTAAFASVTRSIPTTVEVVQWIKSNIPPDKAIDHEPEILFDWVLPRLNREGNGDGAEWVLVSMPNAEVFLNYAAKPTHYSAIDWYPLESVDIEAAMEFYERIFEEPSQYTLVQRFQRQPCFLGIPISDQGAPFPMRALTHPEIRVYQSRE